MPEALQHAVTPPPSSRPLGPSIEVDERTYHEEQNRCRIEQMLLAPENHRWERIGNEDIGEPGCKHWHVRPRFGLLGMLLSWWRVRISSGCPLARGRGRRSRPAPK